MKKISPLVFVILVGICLTSCKSVLRVFSGVRQPHLESFNSVSDYLKKNRIDTFDTLYTCRDSATAMALIAHIINLPSTLLFDSTGHSVQQSDSSFCPAKVEQFMRNLSDTSSIIYGDGITQGNILQWISPVASNPGKTRNSEYHLYVFWATYCGSLNKSAFRVLKAACDNPNIHINLYLVNVDFLDSWGMKSGPKIKYR